MKIYIPTRGRWDRQITSEVLSEAKITHYIVTEDPIKNYNHVLSRYAKFLPCPSSKLSAKRQWILEHAGKSKLVMVDDDMTFRFRTTTDGIVKFLRSGPAEVHKMFGMIDALLYNYAQVGITDEFMCNTRPPGFMVGGRYNGLLAYNPALWQRQLAAPQPSQQGRAGRGAGGRVAKAPTKPALASPGKATGPAKARSNPPAGRGVGQRGRGLAPATNQDAPRFRIELNQDHDFSLQLHLMGFPPAILTDYTKSTKPGANGGVSRYRKAEDELRGHHILAKHWPRFVHVVPSATSLSGFRISVKWKRARTIAMGIARCFDQKRWRLMQEHVVRNQDDRWKPRPR